MKPVIRSVNMMLTPEELCINIKITTTFFHDAGLFQVVIKDYTFKYEHPMKETDHAAYSFPIGSAFIYFASL